MLVIYFKIYSYVRADVFLEDKCQTDEYGCWDQAEAHPNNLENVVVVACTTTGQSQFKATTVASRSFVALIFIMAR